MLAEARFSKNCLLFGRKGCLTAHVTSLQCVQLYVVHVLYTLYIFLNCYLFAADLSDYISINKSAIIIHTEQCQMR